MSEASGLGQASELVMGARRRAVGIQVELDALASNETAALAQLEANRDAALLAIEVNVLADVDSTAITAQFVSGVDGVHAAAASKRAGLETELVAADAALSVAIDAAVDLSKVRQTRVHRIRLYLQLSPRHNDDFAGHFNARRCNFFGRCSGCDCTLRSCPSGGGGYPCTTCHKQLPGSRAGASV